MRIATPKLWLKNIFLTCMLKSYTSCHQQKKFSSNPRQRKKSINTLERSIKLVANE